MNEGLRVHATRHPWTVQSDGYVTELWFQLPSKDRTALRVQVFSSHRNETRGDPADECRSAIAWVQQDLYKLSEEVRS